MSDSNWQISVGILVVFGIAYLSYAPYALYKELRVKTLRKIADKDTEIDSLKEKLDTQNACKARKSVVARLLGEARVLVGASENDEAAPVDAVNAWTQRAIGALTAIDETLALRFTNDAGLMPMMRANMKSKDHSRCWEFLWLRMSRLDEFLKE